MAGELLSASRADGSWEAQYVCTVENGVGTELTKTIKIEVKSKK